MQIAGILTTALKGMATETARAEKAAQSIANPSAHQGAPAEAMLDVQRLPGIGPFYSALIVIRACGLADVLSTQEDHTRAAVQTLYDLDHMPGDAELGRIAEAWRPFRTWAAVSLRAVGSRLIDGPAA